MITLSHYLETCIQWNVWSLGFMHSNSLANACLRQYNIFSCLCYRVELEYVC